jgi:serine phosphatase RsbU (regulator of sigma subunit)
MDDDDQREKELLREQEKMKAEIKKAMEAAEARVRVCLQRRIRVSSRKTPPLSNFRSRFIHMIVRPPDVALLRMKIPTLGCFM